ncbi:hypothetical protein ACFSX9_14055 [Flavobacterium ardleyense]|uniref:Lipoprotein n=1 Tax=Flavobacterium ardleyense TaxID=2038737 RepID=A0ABW5ZCN0_9FLAO
MKKRIQLPKRKIMTNNDFLKLVFTFVLFTSLTACSQTVIIIKDSVAYKSEKFIVEEVKFPLKNRQSIAIQNQIHNANEIFNKPIYESSEQRLRAKKDTLQYLIKNDELIHYNYGFEHYTVLYQNNKFLNLSIQLQSYGSPFESVNYLAFDRTNGKKIDEKYFLNTEKVKKLIKEKLKSQGQSIIVSDKSLSSFVINVDSEDKISGITFIIYDEENYRNSGYERFEANFKWEEIEPHISSIFKSILLN